MLHHSIVVGWAVTPTSLFALPGLFYWQLWVLARLWYRIWCSTLVQNRALSSPRGKYSRCTVGAFRMCKGPKTCESLAPLQGNCNTRPICFISCAAWVSRCPKTNPFLPPTRCMEEGIRAERIFMDKFMADLEQFSGEAGRYGSQVWGVWKIGEEGHHTGDLPTLYTHYQIPIPWKLSLKMPAFGNVTSSGTPWTKVH